MSQITNMVPTHTGPDEVTVTGLVDGISYSVKVWLSHLTQLAAAQATLPLKKAAIAQYCAAQLKATADATVQSVLPAAIDLAGVTLTL